MFLKSVLRYNQVLILIVPPRQVAKVILGELWKAVKPSWLRYVRKWQCVLALARIWKIETTKFVEKLTKAFVRAKI